MSRLARLGRAAAVAAGGAAGRRVRHVVADGPPSLRRRFEVDDDWRRRHDGGAARLDPDTTIAITRTGRWRRIDPLVGNDGWRRPWAAFGLAVWAGAVGVAWWLGTRRGRGPLATLHDPPDPPYG